MLWPACSFQHTIGPKGETVVKMLELMEYLSRQEKPFILCMDCNMTPQSSSIEEHTWMRHMKAEVLAPSEVAATCAGSVLGSA